MADTKLKVTFSDIEVTRDGDPIDKGEIFWNLKVDGSVVSSRSSSNPYKIGSGGTISLGQSSTVTKSGATGTNLIVSGSVSEKDNFLGGKDDSAFFTHNYTPGTLVPGTGINRRFKAYAKSNVGSKREDSVLRHNDQR